MNKGEGQPGRATAGTESLLWKKVHGDSLQQAHWPTCGFLGQSTGCGGEARGRGWGMGGMGITSMAAL